MLKRIRPRLRGNGPWVLISAIGVALLVTPFAVAAGEGRPLDGGARNPSNNPSQSYTRETQIIANLSTYGTRQSNKSNNGGGAIYGCRSGPGGSAANNEPCVRASNLSNGLAFEFATGGTRVGSITSTNTSAAPFTTNATGVATGLNADQVDGQSASQIASAGAAEANRFAQVSVGGSLGTQRGATAASNAGGAGDGTYAVAFAGNISGCALGVTITNNTAGAGATVPGAATAVLAADNSTVNVRTRDETGAGTDFPFHVTVTC